MEKWVNSLRRDAEHLQVRQIDFSGPTYQVEVYDPSTQESTWTFLQFSKEERLKDAFCSCTTDNEKCIHLAAAYLKIFSSKNKPLHHLFEHSFWNHLCRLSGQECGYEERLLEKKGEGLYRYQNEIYFQIQAHSKESTEKLSHLIEQRPRETPENSLKFSNLAQGEVVRWREGRPSSSLRYALSFWFDLAKWMMEQTEKAHLHLEEGAQGLPTKMSARFPDFTADFELKATDLEMLIPFLRTVPCNFELFPSAEEKVENITFDAQKKAFHIEHARYVKTDFLENARALKEWYYIKDSGFYPKRGQTLMSQKVIHEPACAEFLEQFQEEIAKYLPIHVGKVSLNYVMHFDPQWNLHLEAFLFEQGDLVANGLLLSSKWVFLQDFGFYKIEEPLFDELEAVLSPSSVPLFVNRHRIWLNQQPGFQTHLASIESHLAYTLSEDSLRFFTKTEGKSSGMRDFGDWIYYAELGFFSKSHASLGLIVRPGLEVRTEILSAFIKTNKEELEIIPRFFTTLCPLASRSLEIKALSPTSIQIEPVVTLKEGYSFDDIRLFEDFVYLQNVGFYELPLEMCLPPDYREKVIVNQADFVEFFETELPFLLKFCQKIDPVLMQAHKSQLALDMLTRGKGGRLQAQLCLETELGKISVTELLEAIENKKRYCFTEAGLIDLSLESYQWLKHYKGRWSLKKKTMTLSTLELIRLDATFGLLLPPDDRPHAEQTRQLMHELREFSAHDMPDLTGLNSRLRLYQQTGLKWLWFLYKNGLSGLLCDDMGLGKTHQAMALLAASFNQKQEGHYLVVCPTSVIYHWQDKLKTFLPHLEVQTFHGLRRSLKEMPQGGILLTSYGIARVEQERLKKIPFDVAIFDEIQIAKNPSSRVHGALKAIGAHMRVGLTGTPIENNLRELKALFDIVLPGYMPSEARFRELFAIPIERNSDEEKKALLAQLTRPFVLRRKKTEVLQELPEKSEDKAYCELSELQVSLYKQIVDLAREGLLPAIQDASQNVNYVHIFSIFSQLKQVCDHPALYYKEPHSYKAHASGKWDLFVELLEEARESDQKVVVFSQYLFMLDIIADHLKEKGWGYAQIRGDTVNRGEELRRFQEDPECCVFIGSLQAAGLGIDLTAASVVILYDRWWNAARENQAIDRVHRLGQKWRVLVYKLITKNTIEEKIDEMIARKGKLLEEVITTDDENVFKSFSRSELMELLSFTGSSELP